MKKLLVILLFFSMQISFGQTTIANPDFEDWFLYKPAYNFYSPTSWSDGSACVFFNGSESCQFFIQRVIDAQSGQYALAQFTQDNGSGGADYSSFSNVEGTFTPPSFTGRPTSFSFYYKYSTDDNQQMSVTVTLLTGTLDNPTFIGQGVYSFSTKVNSYTKITQDITYFSSSAPTGIFIDFDYPNNPATGYDTLKIDNLTLNYPTGINNKVLTEEFTFSISDKVLTSSLLMEGARVFDMSGSLVTSANNATNELDLTLLKSGIYLLKTEVKGMSVVKKMLVQ